MRDLKKAVLLKKALKLTHFEKPFLLEFKKTFAPKFDLIRTEVGNNMEIPVEIRIWTEDGAPYAGYIDGVTCGPKEADFTATYYPHYSGKSDIFFMGIPRYDALFIGIQFHQGTGEAVKIRGEMPTMTVDIYAQDGYIIFDCFIPNGFEVIENLKASRNV